MTITPSLEHLLIEINRLVAKVDGLAKEVGHLKKENQELKQRVQFLEHKNQQLTQENQGLKRALEQSKTKKNSDNSHLPPSQDRARKNKSLRQKTNKKQGGQLGHEGQTLEMVETPDEVKRYQPDFCERCGQTLEQQPALLLGSRQTIEIPPIKPYIVQHEAYLKVCACGHCTQAVFPEAVTAPISYGASVQGLAAYFHTRQYLPYARMKELFSDVLNLPLSVGSLRNMIHRTAQKARPFYEQIKNKLLQSSFVGSDETSVKVNGATNWMWTWQNSQLTYIVHSKNRAFATIEEQFKDGFPYTVLQHDRYACHFKTPAAGHQICLVHLLRDLQYLDDLYKGDSKWTSDLRQLIYEAMELKKGLSILDYYQPHQARSSLEEKLSTLFIQEMDSKFKKAVSLQKSLRKHQESILTFLYHPGVPPDNNGSERAIRNVKVKQKVSGNFRSDSGAEDFAILRSIADTIIKSRQNILAALMLIAKL